VASLTAYTATAAAKASGVASSCGVVGRMLELQAA
jgi:hypothetical protein